MSEQHDFRSHYQKLEQMYHLAPINTTIPSRLSVGEGTAEVRLTASSAFHHAAKAVHGSIYFKGLDDAAYFAANSVEIENLVLTAKFEVELLGMIQCESIRAVGFFERREGRKIWARSELYDDQDQLMARGSGLFIVGQFPLDEGLNYKEVETSKP